jgi:mono/diheme cytochrome c family protein
MNYRILLRTVVLLALAPAALAAQVTAERLAQAETGPGNWMAHGRNYGEVTWAKGIDPKTGRPIVDLEAADYWTDSEPKTVFPGAQGAHNWPPMSFNRQTGLVYIPQQVTMEHFVPLEEPRPTRAGVPNLGLVVPTVPETLAGIEELAQVYRGNLVAWDPVKQEARWQQPYEHIHNSGTLSTAGNLVLQGNADHCGVCHGLSALSANIIPDLRYLSPEKHEEFLSIVYGLRSHKGMPPFGGILEPEQVEKVHQYIIQRSHNWRDELLKRSAAVERTTAGDE